MTIPDAAIRARALHPGLSFLVRAPAGSGKTELLIQRFLTLLARVDEPEAVVAITFTKKAAGEMRQRVLRALRDTAGPEPQKEHEALTWRLARAVRERGDALQWDLFRNPNRLRIRTIDSLCYGLARSMPWLSGMGAPPDIGEDARELYADAAHRTVALLETGPMPEAVEALLAHLDNDVPKLEALLAGLLARRDQWLRHVAGATGDPAVARAALEGALERVVAEGIEAARALLPAGAVPELVAVAAAAGSHMLAGGSEGEVAACAGMAGLPGDDDPERWLGIADVLLTQGDKWRSSLSVKQGFPPHDKTLKARAKQLIAGLAGNEPLRLALSALRELPGRCFSEAQWQALAALIRLLPLAAAQLQVSFREDGHADYQEVGMAAARALGEAEAPTDLALSLDCRIRHLLVDEFQDTSVSQYELLEKLTAGWEPGDGRTLFAVGDPMQSIYRFREAEVGLFLKAAAEGIGTVPLEPLELTANFRSDSGIVEWVNETFRGVLPETQDITTGAVPFSPSAPVRGAGLGQAVTLHAFAGRNDAAEAARVVELVRAAEQRKARTAILVRARSHLLEILPALRAADLKFRAVEIDALADEPLVRDLASLARALLDPADRIAWLAVLRAPWCGLTLADLHALAAGDFNAAVWDLMNSAGDIARLSPGGRERCARVRHSLARVIDQRAVPLRARVETAWLALGGPACATAPASAENAAAFFDLLAGCEQGGRLDRAAFESRIAQLYARPDSEAGDGLQVMSIHKAKGLEFDVVIVPGLGRPPRADENRLMLWLERPRMGAAPDLLMAPIHAAGPDRDSVYSWLRGVDAAKSEYEDGRLLYVAATRARVELHLLGHAAVNAKDGAVRPAANSLLARMWSAAEPEYVRVTAETAATEPAVGQAERQPQPISRLVDGWQLPAPPPDAPGARATATEAGGAANEALSFRWVGDTLRHIGTVVHRALERIAEDGLERWSADEVARRRPAFANALLGLGVTPAEAPAAAATVVAALTRTLGGERGRWLLGGGHTDARTEYSLTGVDSGELVNARIDRTFIDAAGIRWVVDYKTSAHQGSGIEAFLDNERERYRAQLEGYRRLFLLREARPVGMALYFPLMDAWREIEAGAAQNAGAPAD